MPRLLHTARKGRGRSQVEIVRFEAARAGVSVIGYQLRIVRLIYKYGLC